VLLSAPLSSGVLGQGASPRLQELLQTGLRVLFRATQIQRLQPCCEDVQDAAATLLDAAVQGNGANHRLERVRENRATVPAPTAAFPAAQAQLRTEVQLARHVRQRAALDQGHAQAAKLALIRFGKTPEQGIRTDDVAEHRIAEKLQALVVRLAHAAVRQRPREQGPVVEATAKRPLQPLLGSTPSVVYRNPGLKDEVVVLDHRIDAPHERDALLVARVNENVALATLDPYVPVV
jgi:hypothetical protein